MFTDDFLNNLPEDRITAAFTLCDHFIKAVASKANNQIDYDDYLKALGIFLALCEASGISASLPVLGDTRSANINIIKDFFLKTRSSLDQQRSNMIMRGAHDRYLLKLGAAFAYEFSDGDLERIQILLNELRNLIMASEVFDAKQKERILKKLEALQMELHKKVSSLDKFWGLIGEAGVVLGKFGKDAKPFVDRIKEICQIVWRTQARAEELPSATPLTLLSDSAKDDSN